MLKNRKFLSLMMTLVFMAAVIAGCAGKSSAPSGSNSSGGASLADPASIKADLTVWWWGNAAAFSDWMPEFNEKYPNIKVTVETMGFDDVHNKLIAALAAGDGAPDVTAIEIAFVTKFAIQGGLVDLLAEPYNAGRFKDEMVGYKWSQGTTPDGKLIAMPWDIAPAGFFYRRDTFEKAGLPSEPEQVAELMKTWDGYIDAGKKIVASGNFMVANPMDIFGIYFNKSGIFDNDWNVIVDGPAGQKALNVAKKVRAAGIDAKIGTWSPEWQAALAEGKIATLYGGSWMEGGLKTWIAPDTAGKWGVFQVPEDPAQNWGGSFLSITEQSKNKLAAWALIDFAMTQPSIQNTIYKADSIFPALKSALKDPIYNEPDPFLGGQKVGALWVDQANKIPDQITPPMNPIAEPKLFEVAGTCIEENTDTVKCLTDAKKEIEAAIANDRKIAEQLRQK